MRVCDVYRVRQVRSSRRAASADVREALTVSGERPAFAEFAVVLYGFARRLRRALLDAEVSQALFCAREGRFLARAFDLHQELACPTGTAIETTYFYVSRRASLIGSLGPMDTEQFTKVLKKFPDLDVLGFLKNLGLEDVASMDGVTGSAPASLDAIRAMPHLRAAYESRRLEQADLLRRYVEQLTGRRDDRVHMVDVGWRGTIQDQLQPVLGNRPVHGYYLGLIAEEEIPNLGSKTSLVFGPGGAPSAHYRVLRHAKTLPEFLLEAGHGSVSGYEQDVGGLVRPVLDSQEVELRQHAEVVAPIQENFALILERLCTSDSLARLDDDELQELIARCYARILFFPTKGEIAIMHGRRHYANFGTFHTDASRSLELPGPRQRLRNLGQLVSSPRAVLRGFPPMELHRRGLGALVPLIGAARQVREFPPSPLARIRRRTVS